MLSERSAVAPGLRRLLVRICLATSLRLPGQLTGAWFHRGFVPHPAGVPAQHRVLVPEHQKLGILRLVTAENQDSQAE